MFHVSCFLCSVFLVGNFLNFICLNEHHFSVSKDIKNYERRINYLLSHWQKCIAFADKFWWNKFVYPSLIFLIMNYKTERLKKTSFICNIQQQNITWGFQLLKIQKSSLEEGKKPSQIILNHESASETVPEANKAK